jgi:hypothetical protein
VNTRESQTALQTAYAEHQAHALVRAVYDVHIRIIAHMMSAEAELWELGEQRWSVAYASRVADLETQARRHIEAIAERLKAAAGGEHVR